ncbi:hypothetical protein MAPG_06920 [Magnaporthiopsis poae ATCC 64411]|uniref:Uncharacterized protein n=1 Tax=Magnaporthiopsis poae (strain ATCC 64411 / 73-15) TaxID=644358 RepID=A0A0C4E3C3_MAGP6|nr:hypothetical protein MAPG_06920 [Magnaporthiopsis poae ATCC 64411]
MPPQTRSSAPSSSARRKTPASAPASRVYRHADPPLQQTRFPPPKKTIKTYGRRTTRLSASANLRQQTMTQIGYVFPTQSDESEDDDDDENVKEKEHESDHNDDHDEKGKQPEKPSRNQDVEKPKTSIARQGKQSRPSKRRKTTGDAPSSSFMTQTLTQMLPGSTEREMMPIVIGDSEDDEDEDEDEDEGGDENVVGGMDLLGEDGGEQPSRTSSIVPQTPTHDRKPTSAAAMSLSPAIWSPSVRMLLRNSSPLRARRSPLKDKSTNTSAPLQQRTTATAAASSSEKRKRRPTPRDAVIPDSYSTAGELSSPAAPGSSSGALGVAAAENVSSSLLSTPTRRTRAERSPLGELSLADLPRLLPPPRRRVAQSVGSSPRAPDENTTPQRPVAAEEAAAGPSTGGILRRAARPVDAEIPDSDEELESLEPTPNRSTTTPRRVAFVDVAELEETSDSGLAPETPTRPPPRRLTPAVKVDDGDETVEEPGSPTPVPRRAVSGAARGDAGTTVDIDSEAEAEGSVPETPMRRPSQKTQAAIGMTGSASKTTTKAGTSIPPDAEIEDSDVEADSPSPTPQRTRQQVSPTATMTTAPARSASRSICPTKAKQPSPLPAREVLRSSSPARDIVAGGPGSTLPSSTHSRSAERAAEIPTSDRGDGDGEDTPLTSPGGVAKTSPVRPPSRRSPRKASQARTRGYTQRHTQYETQGGYTQLMESQRVPMEVLREMAPASEKSDVVVTMHPSRVKEVVDGMRNHDFRTTRFPRSVVRLWIYVGRPAQELRYMATLGPARTKGQIDPNTGLGNAEFNDGKRMAGGVAKFAYELVQVYELSNPVSLDRMRENGWTEGQDERGHKFLPPAVVGQLLANLRCALFDDGEQHRLEGDDEDDEGFGRDGGCRPPPGTAATSASGTISQQVEAQIHSDIEHSTHFAARAGYEGEEEEVIPSSRNASPVAARTPARRGMRRSSSTKDGLIAPPPQPQPPQSAGRRVSQRLQQQQKQHQNQSPKTPAVPRSGRKAVSFSQATTASQASTQATLPPSSPIQRLPSQRAASSRKKEQAPILISSSSGHGNSLMTRRLHGDHDEEAGEVDLSVEESYNDYSLRSSSQFYLPESLVREETREPPIIVDSECSDIEEGLV